MKKCLMVLLLVGCMFVLFGTPKVFGQSTGSRLNDKPVTLKCENCTLRKIFKILIDEYQISIGFEESTFDSLTYNYIFDINPPSKTELSGRFSKEGDLDIEEVERERTRFNLDFENERLEKVFDHLISQMPNYKWVVDDDVVNIVPVKGRDKRFEKLLETKIKKFYIRGGVEIRKIRDAIYALPEFTEAIRTLGLPISGNSRFSADDVLYVLDTFEQDLMFSDLTLKQLLNKIAKSRKSGWSLRNEEHRKKRFMDLEI
jgi:hypothetical protein